MFSILEKLKRGYYLSSQISILDNNQILIENCKNILECNENLVRIISNNFEIEIWGSDLFLTNYASNSVLVKGKISSICINERRKSK
ncbi:MAG: hypothetical protein E7509_06680 [Ruminococcus sp.]|nr:hypothetical protein [Ruminococcus sp.]